ncbi:MAG: hypothetical protein A2286_07845 [Gammaproteobacteria bacterium RIFOXYA12_FULL_61_12]|nr:MAG: hypothetical protein A2286_07845 [Gammaproteobacteria bacterium RIFOXYA12_FULL_61_12]
MAKRPTKTEKLRAQLADLQRQLEEAEQAEQEERLKRIEQAIRRSGILERDFPVEDIETALKGVVERSLSPARQEKAVETGEEPKEPF